MYERYYHQEFKFLAKIIGEKNIKINFNIDKQ